jgi:hypothetical protein
MALQLGMESHEECGFHCTLMEYDDTKFYTMKLNSMEHNLLEDLQRIHPTYF